MFLSFWCKSRSVWVFVSFSENYSLTILIEDFIISAQGSSTNEQNYLLFYFNDGLFVLSYTYSELFVLHRIRQMHLGDAMMKYEYSTFAKPTGLDHALANIWTNFILDFRSSWNFDHKKISLANALSNPECPRHSYSRCFGNQSLIVISWTSTVTVIFKRHVWGRCLWADWWLGNYQIHRVVKFFSWQPLFSVAVSKIQMVQ